MKRKNIISKLCATVVAFAMAFSLTNGMTVQAAEEPQEKSVTFEVTPTSINANTHNLGSLHFFFGPSDTFAVSDTASFTIRSSQVPAGATVSRIVIESSVSIGSKGSIYVFLGKDNGDGAINWYVENMSWSGHLDINFLENNDFSPIGTYYLQFIAVRNTTGTIAAATLNNIRVTMYYY